MPAARKTSEFTCAASVTASPHADVDLVVGLVEEVAERADDHDRLQDEHEAAERQLPARRGPRRADGRDGREAHRERRGHGVREQDDPPACRPDRLDGRAGERPVALAQPFEQAEHAYLLRRLRTDQQVAEVVAAAALWRVGALERAEPSRLPAEPIPIRTANAPAAAATAAHQA